MYDNRIISVFEKKLSNPLQRNTIIERHNWPSIVQLLSYDCNELDNGMDTHLDGVYILVEVSKFRVGSMKLIFWIIDNDVEKNVRLSESRLSITSHSV